MRPISVSSQHQVRHPTPYFFFFFFLSFFLQFILLFSFFFSLYFFFNLYASSLSSFLFLSFFLSSSSSSSFSSSLSLSLSLWFSLAISQHKKKDLTSILVAICVQIRLRCVRDRTPGPFYRMLSQTHVNGQSCVIVSQNEGLTSYIFPFKLRVLQWSRYLFNYQDK